MGETVRVGNAGGRSVLLMDSIAYVEESDAGQIVIAGSHGGRSSGRFAIEHALAACFLNDAGIGKDDAGIAALAMFDELGRAGATYDSKTARIGDARDAWQHGVISHVNRQASQLGLVAGERVADAVQRVFGSAPGKPASPGMPALPEMPQASGRKIRIGLPLGHTVILMDSTGYADAADAGHIVVAGSHGGLAGKYGGEVLLAGIFLNDAGGGKDRAGVASFAAFDRIGVPAAAYSHLSARIGDAQDAWDHGILSVVNQTAAALGFVVGEPLKPAIHRVFGHKTPQRRSKHGSE